MALTNVWRRKGDGEWVRTNALQADREYDETVQAVAGHFRCYSCFHYVTFVKSKSKTSYFMHSSGDIDKACEDRSQNTYRTAIYSISDLPMPMRLRIENGLAHFQIGFLPVPEGELRKLFSQNIKLNIRGNAGLSGVYRVDQSRFAPHMTSWIDLPESCVRRYSVSFDPPGNVPPQWKRPVDLIADEGAVFDASTGRRLQARGDVLVGRDYYFVKPHRVCFSYFGTDVSVEQAPVRSNHLYFYKIRAIRYSAKASDFFFDFLKMRLTQRPAEIEVLWPPVLGDGELLETGLRVMWVLSRGEADLQAYPKSGHFVRQTYRTAQEKTRLAELQNVGALQMVCSERYSRAMTCLYIIPLEASQIPDAPALTLHTDKGEVITTDTLEKPPAHGNLHILSEVDGSVEVFDRQGFFYRKALKGNVEQRMIDLKRGHRLVIRQGLDVVRTLMIGRAENKPEDSPPPQWVMPEVPFPRRYAGILAKLPPNSELYKRTLKALRRGSIPRDGMAALQKLMEDLKDE